MASMKPKKSSLPPPKPRQSITVGPQRELNGRIIIGVIVVAAVALGVVIAIVMGGGDDKTADPPPIEDTVASDTVVSVTVEGDPLDPFTDAMIKGDAADTAIGQVAPVVSGVDYEGNAITIDAEANGPTMVVFLAHWCPHCNAEIPHLNEWRDDGNVPEGLDIVGVSTAANPDAPNYPPDQWLVDKDWQWSVLADSGTNTAFGAFGGEYFPTIVIIGSDGAVLTRFSGEPSADEIDELVRNALASDAGTG